MLRQFFFIRRSTAFSTSFCKTRMRGGELDSSILEMEFVSLFLAPASFTCRDQGPHFAIATKFYECHRLWRPMPFFVVRWCWRRLPSREHLPRQEIQRISLQSVQVESFVLSQFSYLG